MSTFQILDYTEANCEFRSTFVCKIIYEPSPPPQKKAIFLTSFHQLWARTSPYFKFHMLPCNLAGIEIIAFSITQTWWVKCYDRRRNKIIKWTISGRFARSREGFFLSFIFFHQHLLVSEKIYMKFDSSEVKARCHDRYQCPEAGWVRGSRSVTRSFPLRCSWCKSKWRLSAANLVPRAFSSFKMTVGETPGQGC